MGCGSSKLDNVGDVIMVPAKIRPALMRKLEQIKAHTRRGERGSSRKELIVKDTCRRNGYHTLSISSDCYGDSQRGSSSSSPDDDDDDEEEEEESEFKDAVETLPGTETPAPGTPKAELEEKQQLVVNNMVAAELLSWTGIRSISKTNCNQEVEYNHEDDQEEEEEEEEEEDLRHRRICPGSPSFRVYYIESLASTIKDSAASLGDFKQENEDEKQRKIERIAAGVDTTQPQGVKHKKGIIRAMRKQGGKLKKVIITKPRPITVTKLLKVPCTGKPKKPITSSSNPNAC